MGKRSKTRCHPPHHLAPPPQDDKPCSGERLLLLYDRWRKLAKAFYSEKKSQFDISKVPDIYDAAKYDAIHNATIMGPKIKDVYLVSGGAWVLDWTLLFSLLSAVPSGPLLTHAPQTAKVLADAAIPNEYGIEPEGRLRISTAICSQVWSQRWNWTGWEGRPLGHPSGIESIQDGGPHACCGSRKHCHHAVTAEP